MRVADTMTTVSDALQDTLDQLEALYGSDGEITGVETGYVDLDSLLLGLQPSNLIVVAARPGAGKCVAWDTPIVDARTGDVRTAAEMHRLGTAGSDVSVLALDDDWQLRDVAPSAFVDDGIKPVYRVRTRTGREIRTTSTHPFLTPAGWLPLEEIAVGSRIAVPRDDPGVRRRRAARRGGLAARAAPRRWRHRDRDDSADRVDRSAPRGRPLLARRSASAWVRWSISAGPTVWRARP